MPFLHSIPIFALSLSVKTFSLKRDSNPFFFQKCVFLRFYFYKHHFVFLSHPSFHLCLVYTSICLSLFYHLYFFMSSCCHILRTSTKLKTSSNVEHLSFPTEAEFKIKTSEKKCVHSLHRAPYNKCCFNRLQKAYV